MGLVWPRGARLLRGLVQPQGAEGLVRPLGARLLGLGER